jgi:NADH pyrophosphatase NudC (nudix superfamily)
MYTCEKCGKKFTVDFRGDKSSLQKKYGPRFCSKRCACSRTYTPEQKTKIKHKLAKLLKINKPRKRFCKKCGKQIHNVQKNSNITVCTTCKNKPYQKIITAKRLRN